MRIALIIESFLFDGEAVANPDDLINKVKGTILDVLYSQKTDVYVVLVQLSDADEIRVRQAEARLKIKESSARVNLAAHGARRGQTI